MKPYLCFGVCNTDGGAQRESEEHQRSQAQKEPPAEAGNHRPTDHGGDQGETRRASSPRLIPFYTGGGWEVFGLNPRPSLPVAVGARLQQ